MTDSFLYSSASNTPFGQVDSKTAGGGLFTQQVFGLQGSMMFAKRTPGYHSIPHKHDCEQLNFVVEGEVWIFVENEGFLMRSGDFSRVPANAVHWAWNRSDQDAVIVEFHSPGLDILPDDQVVRLFEQSETGRALKPVPNIWLPDHNIADVENRFVN